MPDPIDKTIKTAPPVPPTGDKAPSLPDVSKPENIAPPTPTVNPKVGGVAPIVEPPADILTKEFSMADMPGINNDEQTIVPEVKPIKNVPTDQKEKAPVEKPEVKQEEVKVEDATKPVEKPKLKSALDVLKKPGEKKPADANGKPANGLPANRDYSIFTPEEAEDAKQMSNGAFALATKLKKQTLEKSDGLFYQHPEAYITHPEYKKLQTEANYAEKETRFWAQQLDLIRAAKPWKELTGWDAQGNPQTIDRQPTDADEERVRLNLYKMLDVTKDAKKALGTFGGKYQDAIKQTESAITEERGNRFAWVKDPSYLDYSLELPGIGEKTLGSIRSDFISFFPKHLQGSPIMDVAADMFVAIQIQNQQMLAMGNETKVEKIIEDEVQHVEPGSTTKPKGGTNKNGFNMAGTFSADNMPSAVN
jgi:hypothetical protein